ncbi:precorrin-6A/cobalt-precorrin-6A reductase [Kribbella amoyensis]|uniref:Precorrin-6A/cobalt-precorrin-6A reductase n=1 Tax=Kribbella amoyensis TaxID=996641 RepID=A0A561B832_9ACTN|nr:cobalt-precorrin-6A reductase [Kribbella amoyensis]TWD75003.1 precorrin-6A/cobalt-precorrin-6A reductase [Kribbella amoyensis]
MRVLLLGGTGEARELAQALTDEPGVEVVSSLAGRTSDARLPPGAVRQGGFGGVDGLVRWIQEHAVDAVVDATHPFAAVMTDHAAEAARTSGVPLLVLRRPGWTESRGDEWHWVSSAEAAAKVLPAVGSRAFLTIGQQGLSAFAGTGLWMVARCVDPPEPRPDWCTLILDRGPYDLDGELALFREHRFDVLVTKDSGGPQTVAKLVAARQLGVPVVVIRRPPLPAGVVAVPTVDQAVEWVRGRR